jgi:hypothetical protein
MLDTMNVEALKTKFIELLTEEGFRPKLNDHGDVEFKVEGMTHHIDFDGDDPAYLRLLVVNFWGNDDARELHAAYSASSYSNALCKGVKVFVMQERYVWATVEFLVISLEMIGAPLIIRQIEMIKAGTECFRRNIGEIMESVAFNEIVESLAGPKTTLIRH